jgi:amino acid transporter
MHVDLVSTFCSSAMGAPFLAIVAILIYYYLRRAHWRRNRRRRKKNPGFCPSASALGFAFLFLQVFYRPSVANVVEVKQEENADEDDEGDPENLNKQLNRQLKRIRRGEPVDRLILRL